MGYVYGLCQRLCDTKNRERKGEIRGTRNCRPWYEEKEDRDRISYHGHSPREVINNLSYETGES